MASELWTPWGRTGQPPELADTDSVDLIGVDGQEHLGWPAGANFTNDNPLQCHVYYRRSLFYNQRINTRKTHQLPLPNYMIEPEFRNRDVLDYLLAYQDDKQDH